MDFSREIAKVAKMLSASEENIVDVNLLLEYIKEKDGLAIRCIKNPSEKLQLEAMKQNHGAIKYIKNPSEKLLLEIVKKIVLQ